MDQLELAIEKTAAGIERGFDDPVGDEPWEDVAYSISSWGADPEVEVLVGRLNKGVYRVPEFQRGYIWTAARASQFIESLLIGLPVPGIFLYRESGTNTFLVIDGHQRLRTLQCFYEGAHPAMSGPFTLTKVSKRFNGLSYADLLPEDRNLLDTSVIRATVIEQERPAEERKSSVYQIFRRINTGAVPLSPHEIRFCVSYGALATAIKDWNTHPSWRSLVGKINPRMKDQELILRFLALTFDLDSYDEPMQNFLDEFLKNNRERLSILGTDLEGVFKGTCDVVAQWLGPKAFRVRSAVNVAFLDAVLVATYIGLRDNSLRDQDSYVEGHKRLLEDTVFQSAIEKATARKDNVEDRIRKAKEYLLRP